MNAGVFKWREGQSRYNFWARNGPESIRKTETTNGGKTCTKRTPMVIKIVVERVLTENYNDVSGDEQKQYLGDAIPKVFGGWSNTFSFYGIDLSFMIYYSLGGKLYDSDYSQMIAYREGFSFHPDNLNSWTENNKSSSFTRFSKAYSNSMGAYSSKFVFDNTFVRLRNISLGYTLLLLS